VRSAAKALVAQLQAAGVRITTATLAFSGAQGDLAQVEVVDLKDVVAKAQAEADGADPVTALGGTETTSSGI
jgi:hypothetical protein